MTHTHIAHEQEQIWYFDKNLYEYLVKLTLKFIYI